MKNLIELCEGILSTVDSDVEAGGKMYANIADLPWYDVYYVAQTKDVDEYNIPRPEVKKF